MAESLKKESFFRPNWETLPCKLTVLFIDGMMGSIFPFLNLFYVTSGLTPAKAGLSNGIGNCCSLVAAGLWGALADTSNHRALLVTFLIFGTTLIETSKPWVVNYISVYDYTSCSQSGSVHGMQNQSIYSFNMTNATKACRPKLTNPDDVFYSLMGTGVLFSLFFSGLMTYCEGTIIKIIYTRKRKTSYGQQKVFAPIGFALGSFLSGFAIDHFKPGGHLSPFTAAFFVYLGWCILIIPCLYIITYQTKDYFGKNREISVSTSDSKTGCLGFLGILFSNPDTIMFLLSVFVSGLTFNSYTGFIFLFMNSEMHPTKTMMSLTMVSAMASELIIYPLASKIIKCLGGQIPAIIIGIFSFCPRLLLMSVCTEAWQVILIQLLHGIGMSLSWTAMVEYNYHLFPKSASTTAIGVISSLHFVGASVFTNMIGGIIYGKYKGRAFFRGVALMAGGWSVVMTIYFGLRYCFKKKQLPQEENIEIKEKP